MTFVCLEKDDYPQFGARRQGHILVCHGDERPDQWIGWLDPLQARFTELHGLSEEYGFSLDVGEGLGRLDGLREFLAVIGVHVQSNPWEGSLIGGTYQTGWIEVGTVRAVEKGPRRC